MLKKVKVRQYKKQGNFFQQWECLLLLYSIEPNGKLWTNRSSFVPVRIIAVIRNKISFLPSNSPALPPAAMSFVLFTYLVLCVALAYFIPFFLPLVLLGPIVMHL